MNRNYNSLRLLSLFAILFCCVSTTFAQKIVAKTKSGHSSSIEILGVVGDSLGFKVPDGTTNKIPLADLSEDTLIRVIKEFAKLKVLQAGRTKPKSPDWVMGGAVIKMDVNFPYGRYPNILEEMPQYKKNLASYIQFSGLPADLDSNQVRQSPSSLYKKPRILLVPKARASLYKNFLIPKARAAELENLGPENNWPFNKGSYTIIGQLVKIRSDDNSDEALFFVVDKINHNPVENLPVETLMADLEMGDGVKIENPPALGNLAGKEVTIAQLVAVPETLKGTIKITVRGVSVLEPPAVVFPEKTFDSYVTFCGFDSKNDCYIKFIIPKEKAAKLFTLGSENRLNLSGRIVKIQNLNSDEQTFFEVNVLEVVE